MTAYDQVILSDIASNGGIVTNLLHLTERLNLDYSWAHQRVSILESKKIISVKRHGRGSPLVINLISDTTRNARVT